MFSCSVLKPVDLNQLVLSSFCVWFLHVFTYFFPLGEDFETDPQMDPFRS